VRGEIYLGNFACSIYRIANGYITLFANSCDASDPIFKGKYGNFSIFGLATDPKGALYVADADNGLIHKITPAGTESAIAGNGSRGCDGDGGLATDAALGSAWSVAVDSNGVVYASCETNTIRRITPDGRISTLVTLPSEVSAIGSLTCDLSGNVYAVVANGTNSTEDVYRVSPDGVAVPLARSLFPIVYQPDYPVRGWWKALGGIAIDARGNAYVTGKSDNRIRKIDSSGTVSILAGNGEAGDVGDNGPASAAQVANPDGITIDSNGNLLFADSGSNKLRRIVLNFAPPRIEWVAGGGSPLTFRDGPGNTAFFDGSGGIARDKLGNLYVADAGNNRIRKIAPDGTVSTVAGNGYRGFAGDGQLATAASLNHPVGVAVDSKGNLWIADSGNRRIRKVTPDGRISTEAGSGVCASPPPACGQTFSGQVPALSASLDSPGMIAVDPQDNIYFWHEAGLYYPYAGHLLKLTNGSLSPAWEGSVSGMAFDAAGNLYVATSSGIQKVDRNGVATVFANIGGNAANRNIAFDGEGNLYANGDQGIQKVSGAGALIENVFFWGFGSDFVIDPAGVAYGTQFNRVFKYLPAAAARLSIVSGNNQSGAAGVLLPQPLLVSVVDAGGKPLSGVPVQFTVASGSAFMAAYPNAIGGRPKQVTLSVLSSAGTAQVSVTLDGPGPVVVAASVTGLPPVTFTLAGLACTASLSPTEIAVPSAGAYGSVAVTANLAGCPWGAGSNATWVTITGVANGTVSYMVTPNTGAARSGTLTIAGITVTVSQAAGAPGPLVYPYVANVGSGAWITIYGFNLVPVTRAWSASDIVGNQLPTSLDGVSVRIHGRLVYLSYISPSQINALLPVDDTVGPVDLQVFGPNGSSQPVTVQKVALAPSWFLLDPHPNELGRHVAAALPDGTYVAPVGWFGNAAVSRPAIPGETVELFATGLGPTNPPYPDGQTLTQAYPLANPVTVAIGSQMNLPIQFAGLVAPGLYQINLTVPRLPPGDQSICLAVNGVHEAYCVFLPIGR